MHIDIPDGEKRKKATDLMPEIKESYRLLQASNTKEEIAKQLEVTVQELRDMREMRAVAIHNVPIGAFHDTQQTLGYIKKQVSQS